MSPVLRNALVRASRQSATTALGYRAASTHAISNPTLANIEKRWEGMPMQEQAELWMALRDRMKENWADMTVQEKKAGKLPMPSPSRPVSFTAGRSRRHREAWRELPSWDLNGSRWFGGHKVTGSKLVELLEYLRHWHPRSQWVKPSPYTHKYKH
jgi:hypothetical protein